MHRFIFAAILCGAFSINAQTVRHTRGFESISPGAFAMQLPGVRVQFSASRIEFAPAAGGAAARSVVTFAGAGQVAPKVDGDQSWPIRYYGPGVTRTGTGASRLRYSEVYPHIDLVWFVRDGKLEYDWEVHPGGNPDRIRMRLTGAGVPDVKDATTLRLTLAGLGVEQALLTYQTHGSQRQTVTSTFTFSKGSLGFRVGPYDRSRELVIDPALQFLTYVGGAGSDSIYDIQFDGQGFLYLLGVTNSATLFGSPGPTYGNADVFIAKMDPVTLQPLFVTYYGGSGNDLASRFRVSPTGVIWATGNTNSPNLPASPTPSFQSVFQGGAYDGFVMKLSATGQLLYSTYLGGNSTDASYAIDVDDQGSAYVAGYTQSNNFPLLHNAYGHGNNEDAFVTKFDSTGALVYSTTISGSIGDFAWGVNVLPDHTALVTGYTSSFDFPGPNRGLRGIGDIFVAHVSIDGRNLTAELFGGSGDDQAYAAYLGADGFLYITGYTTSSDFPVTANAFQPFASGGVDNFLLKIDPATNNIQYATYIAGPGYDTGRAVTATASGIASVGGYTESAAFGVPFLNPLQARMGVSDGYVVVVDTVTGNLIHSTPIGGADNPAGDSVYALQMDSAGRLWVGGWISGTGLATTPGALQASYAGGTDGLLFQYADPLTVSVAVAPASAALYGGQTKQFSATVTNSANVGVTWSVTGAGSISSGGLYSAPASVSSIGTATVKATALVDGKTVGLATVTLYPPAVVTVTPSAVASYGGQSQQFSASVTNASVPGVSWSVVGGGTISAAGLYTAPATVGSITTATITATSVADSSKMATATVTLYPPLTITVAPATVSLYGGQTRQFTASLTNATVPGVSWSVAGGGTITAAGLYTAPATVGSMTTVTVTATSVADPLKSTTATVTLYPPLTITVTPATASLYGAQTRQFSASLTNAIVSGVTWTVAGGGTITAAGLYTAPATVGSITTVTVTATSVADPLKSTTATVTLYPPLTITVTPATASLYGAQTRQFSASLTNAIVSGVTWTVAGGGTITAAGLYTAPATVGSMTTATITATSVADPSKMATATVTLYPPLTITVAPATVSLYGGQTRQFTASLTNAIVAGVTWTVAGGGTITAAGLYTAPGAVGSMTTVIVTAASVADPLKSATATVTLYPPLTVTVAPATVPLYGAQTQQFSAALTNAIVSGVTWTVAGGGTINAAGFYTAPATVGLMTTATVTVTSVADPSKSATGIVTLYPPLIITLTPTTAPLYSGQTQQFTATVANAPTSAVVWTVTGGGTINNGLYTAPAVVGGTTTVTVTATAVADPAKSATAIVTLNNPGIYWKPVELLLWP